MFASGIALPFDAHPRVPRELLLPGRLCSAMGATALDGSNMSVELLTALRGLVCLLVGECIGEGCARRMRGCSVIARRLHGRILQTVCGWRNTSRTCKT